MFISFRLRRIHIILSAVLIIVISVAAGFSHRAVSTNADVGYIKWVDFKVTEKAMSDAAKLDINSFGTDSHTNWIDLLAILACKYGGDFNHYKYSDMEAISNRIVKGEKIPDITKDMKYFSYYKEAYTAVLAEFMGEYKIENENKYGIKAFLPIAKGYGYSHYDDFGQSRSYGFKREHLGHDMMGSVGTPIVAVESGTVEALGWNQYGGWRIGIRSFDKKRYYYYAHLRKGHPYPKDLGIGHTVKAGDVIGYLGMTGYSTKEDTNNIDTPHLHFGIQLIFDESQKDGNGEIWIDCYEIVKFLSKSRSATVKDALTGEYCAKLDFWEKSVENME